MEWPNFQKLILPFVKLNFRKSDQFPRKNMYLNERAGTMWHYLSQSGFALLNSYSHYFSISVNKWKPNILFYFRGTRYSHSTPNLFHPTKITGNCRMKMKSVRYMGHHCMIVQMSHCRRISSREDNCIYQRLKEIYRLQHKHQRIPWSWVIWKTR